MLSVLFHAYVEQLHEARRAKGEALWELRVGVHTGPLIAGALGTRKFAYDVWGDTVNLASGMESSGEPGKVNVSEATWRATAPLFDWTDRGPVRAEGQGQIQLYVAESIRPELSVDGLGLRPNEAFAEALAELVSGR